MGISIFGNELPSWFTLGLVFVHFGLALKTHYILKKFGKVRKLSGGPKRREEKSNVRAREKKKKK